MTINKSPSLDNRDTRLVQSVKSKETHIMFENFTDRARKVMALANQEALRFNHEYIGTQHLLLGLAKEGSGVGATVLKNHGMDLKKLRREVEDRNTTNLNLNSVGKLSTTERT